VVHRSAPADTDSDVIRRQIDRWRAMTPGERAAVADRLSIDVITMASSGIRRDQPDISDDDLARELVRRCHGPELADAAWPHPGPA
jgi:hypothetical protein